MQNDPLFAKFKEGRASKEERLKLAEKYLKKEQAGKAKNIYEENLTSSERKNKKFQSSIINYGTSLIKSGQVKQGVDILNNYKNFAGDPEITKADK